MAEPYKPYQFTPVKQNTAPDSPDTSIPKKPSSPIQYILDVQKFRTLQDLLKLRVAIADAENVKTYNRYLLHQIYRDVIVDPNLTSQWETRKMKTKEKPFKLCGPDGKEDSESTKILDSQPWFIDWVDAVLDSKEWGFTLIEFGPMLPDGTFMPYQINGKLYSAVNVIDRDNVKPQLGIVTNTPGNMQGISMTDPMYASHLMFVGGYRDYGWLFKAAKYILFKDNCLGNWSEWAEVFGMDKRIGKTAAEGPQREAFIRAIRDLGANAYGVFTPRDEVDFVGTTRTDAYQVYEKMITYIDEQINLLIFGQNVVTNNTGRIVGTVGENVSNMYGVADAKFVAAYVNQRLIPLMLNLGCKGLMNRTFEWDNTEKVPLKDRAVIDQAIASMGFKHSVDYINKTYGTEVEEAPEPEPMPAPGLPVKKKGDVRASTVPMKNGKQKLFVYGTLKNAKTRKEALGEEIGTEPAMAPNEEDHDVKSFPNIEHKNGKNLKGDVLEVTPAQLKKLDEWEEKYKRITIKLSTGERAFVYKMK